MTGHFIINNTSLDIVIVTTAAPPWLTGTAVNPALRAAYLALKGHRVTLLVPFLAPDEQHFIFAPGVSFASAEQQKRHVQRFLDERTGRRVKGVDVVFYPGRYDKLFCSIIPVGDLTLLIKGKVCVGGLHMYSNAQQRGLCATCSNTQQHRPCYVQQCAAATPAIRVRITTAGSGASRRARAPDLVPPWPPLDVLLLQRHWRRAHQLCRLRCTRGRGGGCPCHCQAQPLFGGGALPPGHQAVRRRAGVHGDERKLCL